MEKLTKQKCDNKKHKYKQIRSNIFKCVYCNVTFESVKIIDDCNEKIPFKNDKIRDIFEKGRHTKSIIMDIS